MFDRRATKKREAADSGRSLQHTVISGRLCESHAFVVFDFGLTCEQIAGTNQNDELLSAPTVHSPK